MTTEDEFQAMLDSDPDDWQTRVIFADWLDERGDPRAAGYRALGALRLYPQHLCAWWWTNVAHADSNMDQEHALLDGSWIRRLTAPIGASAYGACYTTRREAEDAAALAFRSGAGA